MSQQVEGRAASASTTLRTILTEFALPRADGLPHAAVVAAMGLVGFEPAAARQALSRAARSGALERAPAARRGEVLLTGSGRELLERMSADADSRSSVPWDGSWTMIAMSGRVDRDSGHATRNRLLLETFGSLGNGMWIAPRGIRAESAVAVLSDDPALAVVSGSLTIAQPDIRHVVARAWDLERVRRVYDEFMRVADALHPQRPDEVLSAWIVLRRQWFAVTHADPNLPEAGLPADWPAAHARSLMHDRRGQWQPTAFDAFEKFL